MNEGSTLDEWMREFAEVPLRDWRERVEAEAPDGSFERLRTANPDGLTVEPLYVRDNAPSAPAEIAFPATCRICPEYDHPSLDRCREDLARDVEAGLEAVWLRCGTTFGTRLWTLGDLAHLLEPVDLSRAHVVLDAENDAPAVIASYLALAQERGIAREDLRGSFGVDPLGALARSGTAWAGLRASFAMMRDVATFCADETPSVRGVLVSTVPYHEGGASGVTELAVSMATAIEYLRQLTERGMSVDVAAAQITFAFGVGPDFFAEVAKLRAARVLWAKVLGAAGLNEAGPMRIHARTAFHDKSRVDPWLNLVRATVQCAAAMIGGADTVATLPFDVAFAAPDPLARRLAANTQRLLEHESELRGADDPARGSYFVETLTDELARAAWDEMRRIEREGGITVALLRGRIRTKIKALAAVRTEAFATGRRTLTGVNHVPDLLDRMLERSLPDASTLLRALGREFRPAEVEDAHQFLLDAHRAVQSGQRPGVVIEIAAQAARAGADMGSLSMALHHGQPSLYIEPVSAFRPSAVWERLRHASDEFLKKRGARPKAVVVACGSERDARVAFARELLASGGIESVVTSSGRSAAGLTTTLGESGASIVVVCAADDPSTVIAVLSSLRDEVVRVVVGAPGEHEAAWRDAGAELVVDVGVNEAQVLRQLHRELGV